MEKQNVTTGFQNVDNSQHQFLVNFLEDVSKLPPVAEAFDIQVKRLDIKPGDHVLDVGCGIGIQAQAMAKLVGDNGKVTGTDISTMMVDISKSRTADSGLPLEFHAADALSQPFPDGSFNCLRTERVLMYIRNTQAVLREFWRLLKPGGRVVAFDFDWDAITIGHSDKELTRKIVRYASDSFPNGRIGGELYHQMRTAGFKDVLVTTFGYSGTSPVIHNVAKRVYEGILQTGVLNGVFSEAEINGWWEAFDKDGAAGDLFVSFAGFIASGKKE